MTVRSDDDDDKFPVIGRGGEQITRLQAESGCKIQMAPDSQGLPERVCSLSGSRDAINRAKELIMNIVHQRGRSEGLGGLDLGPGLGQGNNFQGMYAFLYRLIRIAVYNKRCRHKPSNVYPQDIPLGRLCPVHLLLNLL